MGDEERQELTLKIKSIDDCLRELLIEIRGDDELDIDGLKQHLRHVRNRTDQCEVDLRGLKKDFNRMKVERIKIIAWASGIATCAGLVATWFLKFMPVLKKALILIAFLFFVYNASRHYGELTQGGLKEMSGRV